LSGAIITSMCGRCEGEPYRGVKALFNGDLQRRIENGDRMDWEIISSRVIVYIGATAMANEANPLFRGCDAGVKTLDDEELLRLAALSRRLSRPAIGTP
ncbi:MAG: hypothetical protein B7Z16_18895, partial [Algoriphagus sp. 32-45-6]